jgi:hypothetical protein
VPSLLYANDPSVRLRPRPNELSGLENGFHRRCTRLRRLVSVLTQGDAEAQEPAVCTARSRLQLALHARRDPFRDEIREVGRGLSLAGDVGQS